MNRQTSKKAFTLIELALIIALTALLMTFVMKGLDVLKDVRLTKVRTLAKNAPLYHIDDLIIWYETSLEDSFEASQRVEGGNITIWYNRAPIHNRKNSATQDVVANQPKYFQNIFNKVIPAIRFDGNDFMNFNGLSLVQSDYTLFFVEQRTSSNSMAFIGGTTGSANQNLIAGYRNSSTLTIDHWSNSMNISVPDFSSPATAMHTFLMSSRAGVGKRYWLNGGSTPDASDSSQTVQLINYQGSAIGRQSLTPWYFTGNMAEIIIFNRALEDDERQEVEKYLSEKYQIVIE